MTYFFGSRAGTDGPRAFTPRGTFLPLCLEERRLSPDGFDWGNSGRGAAQLAYAILRYHTGSKTLAGLHFRAFTTDVIAGITETFWKLESTEIAEWLDTQAP